MSRTRVAFAALLAPTKAAATLTADRRPLDLLAPAHQDSNLNTKEAKDASISMNVKKVRFNF